MISVTSISPGPKINIYFLTLPIVTWAALLEAPVGNAGNVVKLLQWHGNAFVTF